MELYNAQTMPLSNDSRLRIVQEKIIKGEPLTMSDKMIAGRDHPIKELAGYQLKPDHVYRAISEELFELYKKTGFICGVNSDDEYQEFEEDGKIFNNNQGVDWYLGGVDLKYGDIILECPADKEYFVPAYDNGSGMSFDPTVRFLKSSGAKKPIPITMLTNVFDVRQIKEQQTKQDIDNFMKGRDLKMEEKNMPSLDMVNSKMDRNNKKYSFDVESIDKQIPVPQLTKLGSKIFLYRKKINISTNYMPYIIRSTYFLVDINGNILGKISVHNNGYNDKLEIDYFIKPEYQGQGLGTIALFTVVDDIFFDKEFDNLPYRRNMLEEETITCIESIYLSINSNNIASQIVAMKNGFVKTDDTTFIMTQEDYKKSRGIDSKTTISH